MPPKPSSVFSKALQQNPTRQQLNAAKLAKNGLEFLHPARARSAKPSVPVEPTQLIQILAYFAEDSPDEPMQNRLVMLWQQSVGYEHVPIHVEIFFVADQLACSVAQGGMLSLGPRGFSSRKYRVLALEVKKSQYDAMLEHCRKRVAENVNFDIYGMYSSILPSMMRLGGGSNRTFCSRHIAETLQVGKLPAFENVDPHGMSPAQLFDTVLNECSPVMDTIKTREFK